MIDTYGASMPPLQPEKHLLDSEVRGEIEGSSYRSSTATKRKFPGDPHDLSYGVLQESPGPEARKWLKKRDRLVSAFPLNWPLPELIDSDATTVRPMRQCLSSAQEHGLPEMRSGCARQNVSLSNNHPGSRASDTARFEIPAQTGKGSGDDQNEMRLVRSQSMQLHLGRSDERERSFLEANGEVDTSRTPTTTDSSSTRQVQSRHRTRSGTRSLGSGLGLVRIRLGNAAVARGDN